MPSGIFISNTLEAIELILLNEQVPPEKIGVFFKVVSE
jgi:hypothetical protein